MNSKLCGIVSVRTSVSERSLLSTVQRPLGDIRAIHVPSPRAPNQRRAISFVLRDRIHRTTGEIPRAMMREVLGPAVRPRSEGGTR